MARGRMKMEVAKRAAIVWALLVLCKHGAFAQGQTWDFVRHCPNQSPGYPYAYESLVQYGYGAPDYYYFYFLQNNSNQYDIVSWTWSLGSFSGTLFPHPWGAEFVYGYDLPLQAEANPDDAQWRAEDNNCVPCPPIEAVGTITWSDGHTTTQPVWVPVCLVPEPSSAIALIFTIFSFSSAGLALRRTKR